MEHELRVSFLLLGTMLALASVRSDPAPGGSFDATAGNGIESGASMTVGEATAEQIMLLGEALTYFDAAGLELPALEFSFPDDRSCGDAPGRFAASDDRMRITICPEAEPVVYVHELAHAWEHSNVSDRQRDAFMDLRGLAHWSGADLAWNERGNEWAAVVIQQGLSGLPLPPVLSTEAMSRLQGFEILTGRAAPTLVAWIENRDVPCVERPTALSLPLVDATGRSCE